jgi:hypothetical protein
MHLSKVIQTLNSSHANWAHTRHLKLHKRNKGQNQHLSCAICRRSCPAAWSSLENTEMAVVVLVVVIVVVDCRTFLQLLCLNDAGAALADAAFAIGVDGVVGVCCMALSPS